MITEELKKRPDLALVIQELNEVLRCEQEKRKEYRELIHENIKAEFINGEIVYHSPVKRMHWKISMNLCIAIGAHVKKNDLGELGAEKVMITLTRNDYEPDIVFFNKEKSREFEKNQMLFPAPDFVIEILSETTEKYDRNEKFLDYAAHGVQEYWIIDPEKECLEQYKNQNNRFELFEKLQHGTVRSLVIDGFSMDLADIFAH